MYQPKMGIVNARKLGSRSIVFLFIKTVQDYGKRSADICLVTQAVGQEGAFSLFVIAPISMFLAPKKDAAKFDRSCCLIVLSSLFIG